VPLPVLAVAAVTVVAVIVVPGANSGGGTAVGAVRVNQVGYDATSAKRAYLMTDRPVSGTPFRVRSKAGEVVFEAPVGHDLGAWSDRFPHVYALDFDRVTRPGRYVVEVPEVHAATSPTFRLDTPARLYAPLLANATSFYQAQRDGPDVVGSVLDRQPAHLNDRMARVYQPPRFDADDGLVGDLTPVRPTLRRDVSGGWFDAGDYIKGTQTSSYTLDMLLVAVRDHPELVGDLATEVRFGLDWLQKMWDDPSRTLYYQVGLGDGNDGITGDHDLWRRPEVDDTFGGRDPASRYIRHRPVFRAGPPGSPISPNQAGRLSAALALCYQVFRTTDPAYANRCLVGAEHVFALADTRPKGDLVTFSPFDFYPETEWRSDLELGAIELHAALTTAAHQPGGRDADPPRGLLHTDPDFYLRKAAHWADAYMASDDDAADSLNLYDVSALAHYELHRAITRAGDPSGLAVRKGQLVADIGKQLDNARAQAHDDPFGFGFPYSSFDGTSHAQGLAITASFYDELTGTTRYAAFGRRQLGVILGSNAWGASFIVGAGTDFPRCVHHQVANLDGSLEGERPILRGAAVNGTNGVDVFEGLGVPDEARACPPAPGGSGHYAPFDGKGARYLDDVTSWPTSEPALDFVATTPLAFARQIAVSP
jgi:endoglucanase